MRAKKPLEGHACERIAAGELFDEPIGSAGIVPQGGFLKPPA